MPAAAAPSLTPSIGGNAGNGTASGETGSAMTVSPRAKRDAPLTIRACRASYEAAGGVVDAALALDPLPRVIWMQLSVRNDAAALRAEARGVEVVMNRCPKIEYGRLSGEIKWSGVNSRIISSQTTIAGAGFQRLTLDRG